MTTPTIPPAATSVPAATSPSPSPTSSSPPRGEAPPSTAVRTGPSPARLGRSARASAAVLAIVAVGIGVLVVFAHPAARGELDPRSPRPAGAMAVAQLLRGRGIDVVRVTDPAAVAGSGAGAPDAAAARTVVVPFPGRLTSSELGALAGVADRGAQVVLVDPSEDALRAFGLDFGTGTDVPVRDRDPGCFAPEAMTAGSAETGGTAYTGTGTAADCYPVSDGATVVIARAGEGTGDGRVVALGSAAFLTNERLGRSGDAALALELLAARPHAVWLIPPPGRPGATAASQGLLDLLPTGVQAAIFQLFVALVVLALSRGRRLGPPVPERLPAVVRASETVEGRARLYRSARAVGLAGEALRHGSRTRLAESLGVTAPAGESEPDRATLVAAVAAATRSPGKRVEGLLYGSAVPQGGSRRRSDPSDGLVRLARDLDDLEREARA